MTMRRINEWCEDLIEAVFCEYFPTFIVVVAGLFILGLALIALGITAEVFGL